MPHTTQGGNVRTDWYSFLYPNDPYTSAQSGIKQSAVCRRLAAAVDVICAMSPAAAGVTGNRRRYSSRSAGQRVGREWREHGAEGGTMIHTWHGSTESNKTSIKKARTAAAGRLAISRKMQ